MYVTTNIYAPNSPTHTYFQDMTAWFTDNINHTYIVGGDFNSTMIDQEDMKHTRTSTVHHIFPQGDISRIVTLHLHLFTDATRLTDIWRLMHPTKREFTHYSHAHHNFSRIDYLLVTNNIIKTVSDTSIQEIAISDHALVLLHFKPYTPKPKYNILRSSIQKNQLPKDIIFQVGN